MCLLVITLILFDKTLTISTQHFHDIHPLQYPSDQRHELFFADVTIFLILSVVDKTNHIVVGDYSKAEPLLQKALESRKKALGENHPDYATSLNNLAELYHNMGDYSKAEPLLQKALEIRKKALGENYPDYATSLDNPAE